MAKKLKGEEFYLSANDLNSGGVIYLAKNKWTTNFNEAIKIKKNSNLSILPGSKIIVYRKPDKELNSNPDRLQQLSSIITSLVTIAILANTTSSN